MINKRPFCIKDVQILTKIFALLFYSHYFLPLAMEIQFVFTVNSRGDKKEFAVCMEISLQPARPHSFGVGAHNHACEPIFAIIVGSQTLFKNSVNKLIASPLYFRQQLFLLSIAELHVQFVTWLTEFIFCLLEAVPNNIIDSHKARRNDSKKPAHIYI